MLENYVPDMYFKNIFSVNYKKLKNIGIKCIIFDLDNTIVPSGCNIVAKKVIKLFEYLKSMGFKLIIMSNANKDRVDPIRKTLLVDSCASSYKPFDTKFLAIMEKYNYKESELCLVGDELVTDIYGANMVGITSILVNAMSEKEVVSSTSVRRKNKLMYKKLYNKDLLTIGAYYE